MAPQIICGSQSFSAVRLQPVDAQDTTVTAGQLQASLVGGHHAAGALPVVSSRTVVAGILHRTPPSSVTAAGQG